MIVSLALACSTEKEHYRKDEGDIIAVMPQGHAWGKKEVEAHLIIQVDLGPEITDIADARKLMVSYMPSGDLWYPDDFAWRTVIWDKGRGISETILGRNLSAVGTRLAKRRYHVPFNRLRTYAAQRGWNVNWGRIGSPLDAFQPPQFQSHVFPLDMIEDKAAGTDGQKNGPLNDGHMWAMKEVNK